MVTTLSENNNKYQDIANIVLLGDIMEGLYLYPSWH